MISPARQDHLEAEDVVARRAVLERPGTAGALGDVAADHGLAQAGRIRRVEEPDALDRVLEVAGDHVRLDDGQQVRFVDLEDAVHPLERQHDAAFDGHGPAAVSRAAAPHHEGHPRPVAHPGDRRDLAGGSWQHDKIRRVPLLQRVEPVALARVGVALHVGGSHDLRGVLGEPRRKCHARQAGLLTASPAPRSSRQGGFPVAPPDPAPSESGQRPLPRPRSNRHS